MKIIRSISELRSELAEIKTSKIGFVPTMGALHKGHLSLIQQSKEICDITICSIFVNKKQFDNSEDFDNYPSTLNNDIEKLESKNCDILFAPSTDDIYKNQPVISFNFGSLESVMEGAFRPGHFSGMALIVSKLFNIVQPNVAFFGQKDFQQLAIIKRLVSDLNFDIEICPCDIVRESSGLAMSSRNERLSKEDRADASFIFKSLKNASELLKVNSVKEVITEIQDQYAKSKLELEYFEIVDSENLLPVLKIDSKVNICVAAHIGGVRLIDNIIVE